MMETTSLFVRLLALADHSKSMDGLFNETLLTFPPDHVKGSECTEWMIEGEQRVAATPQTDTGTRCDTNLSPSENLAAWQAGCFADNQKGQTVSTGLCCINQAPSTTYGCSNCPDCNCGTNLVHVECDGHFHNCGEPNPSDDCKNSQHAGDASICCNSNTDSGWCPCSYSCGVTGDGICALTTTPIPPTNNINYVGTNPNLAPLDSPLPRLRGMFPNTPFVAGLCKKATTPPYFFASVHNNACVMGTPRPPLAGILVTSSAPGSQLLYTQTYYEPPISKLLSAHAPVLWRDHTSPADGEATRVYE